MSDDLEDFKRNHHNPVVGELNKEIADLRAENERQLLPCPFCGKQPTAFKPGEYDGGEWVPWFEGSEFCGCADCGIEMFTDSWQKQVVAAALREQGKEIANLKAAIEATLKLADFLNDVASGGAGFGEHWGERVMQAVEPLRDVGKFSDATLAHNQILLEANSENIEKIADLRVRLDESEKDREWTRQLLNEQRGENSRLYNEKNDLRAELALQEKKRDAYVKESLTILGESEKEVADLRAECDKLKAQIEGERAVHLRDYNNALADGNESRREANDLKAQLAEQKEYGREYIAKTDEQISDLEAQLASGQLYDCPRCGSRMRLAMEKSHERKWE